MMQIKTLDDDEIEEFKEELYSYFKTGYEFEDFLKEYLIKIGLDEVQITQRSRDGGIDLTAIRKGIGNFSETDVIHYYIQAKKYTPKTKISVSKIRELKGTIPFGNKGIFITTSSFTSDALTEAENDISKPVVLIDGKQLVLSCIDHQIGFLFKPIFSKIQMDNFLKKNSIRKTKISKIDFIEKTITINDIRARIISIPSVIMNKFDKEQEKIKVIINGEKEYIFTINRKRNYFGGVTLFFKDYNLRSDEGVISSIQSKWDYDSENKVVKIYLGEKNE